MTFSQIKDYSYQIVDLRSKIQEYEATKYNRVVDTVSSDRVDRENLLDINSVIDSYIDERKKITGLSKIKYTTTGNNYDCLPYTVIDLKEVVDGAFLKPGNLFYHTVDGWDSLDVTNPDPILDPNLHASYETWGTDTVISGNIAYWNMDAVSNIPNEPTGVAYEWNKVDTSGWVASNCILTFSGGVLVNTITNSSNNIKRTVTSFVGTNFKTVKIRLRQTSGTLSGSFSFFGNEPAIRKDVTYTSPRLGEWKIVDIDMTTPTAGAWIGTSISNITIAFSASSGVYEISDIYVGNGAYSTGSLADNSGNGNHGTIYGATPVAGISGKALAFDGVNDYVENGYQDSTAYTLSAWIKRVGSGSAAQDIMYLNRSASGGRLILRILSNAITAICVDAALASKTITGPTVGESWTHLTVTHSGATMALYVNGDLVQSLATTLTSVYYNILRLGSQGTALGFFFSGTIDEPRIYNRALSAEEVKSLYEKDYNEKNLITMLQNSVLSNVQTDMNTNATRLKNFMDGEIAVINSNTQKIESDTTSLNNAIAFRDYLNTWINSTASKYLELTLTNLLTTLSNRVIYVDNRNSEIITYMTTGSGSDFFQSRYKIIAKRINKFFGTLNAVYRAVLLKVMSDKSSAADQETFNGYSSKLVSKKIVESGTGDFFTKIIRDTDSIEGIYNIGTNDKFYVIGDNSNKLGEEFTVKGKSKSSIKNGIDENSNQKTIDINVLSLNKKVSKEYSTENNIRAVKIL